MEFVTNSMCHARKLGRITKISNIDVHGRAGLVGVLIVYQQDLKLVG